MKGLVTSAGKSFEDDDVELICTKSGLGSLQALTEALASTDSSDQQQSLLQACCCHSAHPWCYIALLLRAYCHASCCQCLGCVFVDVILLCCCVYTFRLVVVSGCESV